MILIIWKKALLSPKHRMKSGQPGIRQTYRRRSLLTRRPARGTMFGCSTALRHISSLFHLHQVQAHLILWFDRTSTSFRWRPILKMLRVLKIALIQEKTFISLRIISLTEEDTPPSLSLHLSYLRWSRTGGGGPTIARRVLPPFRIASYSWWVKSEQCITCFLKSGMVNWARVLQGCFCFHAPWWLILWVQSYPPCLRPRNWFLGS